MSANQTAEYRLAIGLDFDGTIAQTTKGVFRCLEVVAQHDSTESLKKLSNEWPTLQGLTLLNQLQKIVNTLPLEVAKNIFMEFYPVLGIPEMVLNKGFRAFHNYAIKNMLDLYIISAKSERNLELSMEFLGITSIKKYGGLDEEGKRSKIKDLKLKYYVGDQYSDIRASIGGGAIPILFNSVPKIGKPLEIVHIEDFEELIDLLEDAIPH